MELNNDLNFTEDLMDFLNIDLGDIFNEDRQILEYSDEELDLYIEFLKSKKNEEDK